MGFVDCPQCGFEVRVTDDEALTMRSFCTACETRFGLAHDETVGDGPFRVAPTLASAWNELATTDRVRATEVEGETRIELMSNLPARRRWATWLGSILGMLAALLFVVASQVASPDALLAGAVSTSVAAIAVLVWTSPRLRLEVVRIDRGGVTIEARGRRRRCIAIGDVAAVRALPSWRVVELELTEGTRLRIGRGLEQDLETLDWVARRIERALGRARSMAPGLTGALRSAGSEGR